MENWLELAVAAAPERLDAVSAFLIAENVGGLVLEEESDFKRFLKEFRQHWDYVDEDLLARWKGLSRVKFYLPNSDMGLLRAREIKAGLNGLCRRMGWPEDALAVSVSPLASADWENGWKQYYRPIASGKRLYIVPAWEEDAAVPDGRIPLLMNPGLIFGTGSHASTRLCLEALEHYIRGGERVLDLGCGSGILSIAALLLGARLSVGCDIDEKAADIVRENGAYNQLGSDRLSVFIGDVLGDRRLVAALTRTPSDVILANIVADVIIPLSVPVPDWLAPDGVFICSGVIDTRAAEVEAALVRNGLSILERNERDGWVSFAARRAK
jgi:ribosomal protein L11 methyltransferase